ncbi:MAG: FtsW/RodA/SpoVE family cell cycle protein [Erysipelotrichaceae bacterium]|nr:FtsW/RodA/SpoVE family cell cycle protein [Erysipelotrichaceae bacterium]
MNKKRTWLMPAGSDAYIHWSLIFLSVFGVFMVASASMGIDIGNTTYVIFTVIKQLVFLIAGYIMMVFLANKFGIRLFLRFANMLSLIVIVILLVPLAFPAIGSTRAWIRVPIMSFEVTLQPSEFAKTFMIVYFALGFMRIKNDALPFKENFKYQLYMLGIYVFIIIFLQRDFGSGFVLLGICMVELLAANYRPARGFQALIIMAVFAGMALLLFIMSPPVINFLSSHDVGYQLTRFISAANPFKDRYGNGYQLVNGLISFASGGLFGLGYGNSLRKYSNFPAANTDYILAIIVEELGFVGFLAVFIAYSLIIYRLFKYAFKINNNTYRMILIGNAMYLVIHFILNVGGVTGILPLTGVPLLMLSSGGSSAMSFMMIVGVSQNIISHFNTNTLYKEQTETE